MLAGIRRLPAKVLASRHPVFLQRLQRLVQEWEACPSARPHLDRVLAARLKDRVRAPARRLKADCRAGRACRARAVPPLPRPTLCAGGRFIPAAAAPLLCPAPLPVWAHPPAGAAAARRRADDDEPGGSVSHALQVGNPRACTSPACAPRPRRSPPGAPPAAAARLAAAPDLTPLHARARCRAAQVCPPAPPPGVPPGPDGRPPIHDILLPIAVRCPLRCPAGSLDRPWGRPLSCCLLQRRRPWRACTCGVCCAGGAPCCHAAAAQAGACAPLGGRSTSLSAPVPPPCRPPPAALPGPKSDCPAARPAAGRLCGLPAHRAVGAERLGGRAGGRELGRRRARAGLAARRGRGRSQERAGGVRALPAVGATNFGGRLWTALARPAACLPGLAALKQPCGPALSRTGSALAAPSTSPAAAAGAYTRLPQRNESTLTLPHLSTPLQAFTDLAASAGVLAAWGTIEVLALLELQFGLIKVGWPHLAAHVACDSSSVGRGEGRGCWSCSSASSRSVRRGAAANLVQSWAWGGAAGLELRRCLVKVCAPRLAAPGCSRGLRATRAVWCWSCRGGRQGAARAADLPASGGHHPVLKGGTLRRAGGWLGRGWLGRAERAPACPAARLWRAGRGWPSLPCRQPPPLPPRMRSCCRRSTRRACAWRPRPTCRM